MYTQARVTASACFALRQRKYGCSGDFASRTHSAKYFAGSLDPAKENFTSLIAAATVILHRWTIAGRCSATHYQSLDRRWISSATGSSVAGRCSATGSPSLDRRWVLTADGDPGIQSIHCVLSVILLKFYITTNFCWLRPGHPDPDTSHTVGFGLGTLIQTLLILLALACAP